MRKHQQVELLPWESEGARKADGLTNSYCPYGKKIRDTCIARDALPGASLCVFFWKDKLKCRIGQGLTLNEQCPQLRKLAEGYHGGHVALWCQKITTASNQCLRLVNISNMCPGPLISFDDIMSPQKNASRHFQHEMWDTFCLLSPKFLSSNMEEVRRVPGACTRPTLAASDASIQV